MPSIAAHMAVAKLVGETLDIKTPDFIRGNLLPDIIKSNDSHHKIPGKCFEIPDLDYFKNNLDLNNNLYLGCYVHLLLDKYFLDEFVPNYINRVDVFKTGIMYNEYNKVSYGIVKNFKLDVPYLVDILKEGYKEEINENKLADNLKFLKNRKIEETKYLKVEEFTEFLSCIAKVISKEVEIYGNKNNKLLIRSR